MLLFVCLFVCLIFDTSINNIMHNIEIKLNNGSKINRYRKTKS